MRVAAGLIAAISAVSSAAILLVTAESVQAERAILATLDDPQLRMVSLLDVDGSGAIAPSSVGRVARLSTVEWAIGLGPSRDVSAFDGGRRVPLRSLFGDAPPELGLPPRFGDGLAAVGESAGMQLSLESGAGVLISDGRPVAAVAGGFATEPPLGFLDRIVLRGPDGDERPRQIVLLVSDPRLAEETARLALGLVGSGDPSRLSLDLPADLSRLREAIRGEVGRSARITTLTVIAAAAATIALVSTIGVILRRPDLGRRRALGATRSGIIGLVMCQTALVSVAGSALGAAVSVLYQSITAVPALGLSYALAVVILTAGSAILSSVIPAVTAALADPVRVLRVP